MTTIQDEPIQPPPVRQRTSRRPRPTALIAALAILILVAVAGFTYASPYFVPGAIKQAALDSDFDKLDQLIDFPRVREGLKADFQAYMAASMATELSNMDDNPFAAGFAALAMNMVNGIVTTMVDAVVSPAGVVKLVEGAPRDDLPPALTPVIPSRVSDETFQVESQYLAFDRFRYTATDLSTKGVWTIDMKRQGLFGWQVTRVGAKLPPYESGK